MGQAHEADPSLIPRLTVLVQDQGNNFEIRDASARALVEIAQKHPDYRQQCIAILNATLERYLRNPLELNTSLISLLLDLKAREAANMIQQVIQAGEYDRKAIGDWQDVSRALGVFQPTSSHPPPPPASRLSSAAVDPAAAFLSPDPAHAAATISSAPHLTDKQREKLRAKRKKERKAKKQNRRR
jgi:hypothetical protein